MKKSRYTESQIIGVLKEVDAGRKVEEVCRQHGISSATYYNWKSKYGGMEASDVKRLKELEEENVKLKKMFVYISLENNAIKELVAKKGW
ncbi:putative transposase [Vibrio gazogenes DSM 21264]|uniref:Putative transposase n=1 Tax=Vibrio gazogenes DSM 21264 = NBRC 103151 TaxID=1123492 RepID=A0A1M4YV77_VIBGA|nr:putative transposase [Vibrio gazogenes DSM 21264] [Vibrio gazogenes DSM 21264 = NBRC 103151]SJN56388.1 Transposase [Vibrio gazogenes]